MAEDNKTLLGIFLSLFLYLIVFSFMDELLSFYINEPVKLLYPDIWQIIFAGVVFGFLFIIALVYKGILKVKLPKRLEL